MQSDDVFKRRPMEIPVGEYPPAIREALDRTQFPTDIPLILRFTYADGEANGDGDNSLQKVDAGTSVVVYDLHKPEGNILSLEELAALVVSYGFWQECPIPS